MINNKQVENQYKLLIKKVALATCRFITGKITREQREKIYDEVYKKLQTIATKSAERDLKFLKEIRGYAGTLTNLVDWEMVTTMIDDWIFELEALSKPKE